MIHPTAVIAPEARIGAGVSIGPYAIVGPHVELGAGVVLHPHAVVDGHTKLGPGVEVFPGAAIGLRPQDLKYDGSPTVLEIGPRTILRECVTVQPGTSGTGRGRTVIGSDCLIMAYCHVAHDCVIGDRVVMANATQIAGHVQVDDGAILGGVTTIHQFVRIGKRAITGAATRVMKDIPPFTTADGHPARLYGLNTIGLKRAKMPAETIGTLKRAYRRIFLRGPWAAAIAEVEAELAPWCPEVAELCAFLRSGQRGITRAGRDRDTGADGSFSDGDA
ncbi:MAG: acyl-ACP--UDP-N-acetylglucosamine O-acyltransferase [Deltaproteobacteria bacterium]|nr:acyl-ACP--UDP-N-acetylglucosamine O-acyltransferase [Deltaproteobacteria bacterium]